MVSRGPPQPRAPLDPERRLGPEVFCRQHHGQHILEKTKDQDGQEVQGL